MKSSAAPGDKARNGSYRGKFNSGSTIKTKDATKRREGRGGFGAGAPHETDLRRRGRKNKSFDIGGNMSGGARIPRSRSQKTA
jgi:hypothetical protein